MSNTRPSRKVTGREHSVTGKDAVLELRTHFQFNPDSFQSGLNPDLQYNTIPSSAIMCEAEALYETKGKEITEVIQ